MYRIIVLVAVAAILAACGSSEKRGAVDRGQKADVTSTRAPDATIAPTVAKAFGVGDTVKTSAGNTVRVISYETPATGLNRFVKPKDGMTLAAIDVELCAGVVPTSGSSGVNPYDFELQMPDNTRLRPSFGKEPALHDTQLVANDCARGWVTFDVPLASKPSSVNYRGSSLIKWIVP